MELEAEHDEVEINSKYKKGNFFGVYMLNCLNPKYKAKIYIGFTTNPKRRLLQHNKGKWAGGAKKTNCKGPWEMVVIVHQFPSRTAALAFEWAWQHPDKSRRMKNFEPRHFRETQFNYYCRALQELLSVGPWNKLPLEMSWLNENYMKCIIEKVPKHMPWEVNTAAFQMDPKKKKLEGRAMYKRRKIFFSEVEICFLCHGIVPCREKILCKTIHCYKIFHIICLAERFTKGDSLLPIEGRCPKCRELMLWGDLVRIREDLIQSAEM